MVPEGAEVAAETTAFGVTRLVYISHPEVVIDPAVAVPQWGLTDVGRRRMELACAEQWMAGVGRVIASAETKSLQAAAILAGALDLDVEVRSRTGETDRSSTGFVPHDEHERLADAFFAAPEKSIDGWEPAIDVQTRVFDALADLLSSPEPVVAVGHGGAGTLLYCRFAGVPIARSEDQSSPGNYFTVDLTTGRPIHSWQPLPLAD